MDPLPPDDGRPRFSAQEAQRFSEAFAGAVSGVPASQVPEVLCRACVDLLDITGASISLVGDADARALWWSSDERAGRLAEAQYTLGDGPCRTAMTLVAPSSPPT
ncbi:hypothetical protein [Streptomyces exfoliatus]|uniref:hypothetical protein n=1 Tax=Streptomyces exfoliatus TaxID=1905 RepID=UPI003C2F59F1